MLLSNLSFERFAIDVFAFFDLFYEGDDTSDPI
jgi:hypothetical protein